jgi:hypothetical protein
MVLMPQKSSSISCVAFRFCICCGSASGHSKTVPASVYPAYTFQDIATCYSNFFDDSYSVIYLDDTGIKWNAESFSKDVVWEDQTGEKILQI